MKHRLLNNHITISEDEAEHLSQPSTNHYTVEVKPADSSTSKIPETLSEFTDAITEFQTSWLGLKNTSPTTIFEILRPQTDRLRFQYHVPTKRLERKIRLHLSNQIPKVGFQQGTTELPVGEGGTVGGGFLTTGYNSYHPLRYEFDSPPNNAVVSALHRHAAQNTRYLIQILFQPVAGHSLKQWLWRKRAYHHRNYLKKEKEALWRTVQPTKRERKQAQEIDDKAGEPRYRTSIRFLIINAADHTPSRIKELAGAYNTFENPETGQYLDAVTITRLRRNPILRFAETVAQRRFSGWTRSFQTTAKELAALLSMPDKQQENIRYNR